MNKEQKTLSLHLASIKLLLSYLVVVLLYLPVCYDDLNSSCPIFRWQGRPQMQQSLKSKSDMTALCLKLCSASLTLRIKTNILSPSKTSGVFISFLQAHFNVCSLALSAWQSLPLLPHWIIPALLPQGTGMCFPLYLKFSSFITPAEPSVFQEKSSPFIICAQKALLIFLNYSLNEFNEYFTEE